MDRSLLNIARPQAGWLLFSALAAVGVGLPATVVQAQTISTMAGSGTAGCRDGDAATSAQLKPPMA